MNYGEIFVANGTALLMLILLMISRHMTKLERRPDDNIFSAIIVIVIAGTFLEPLTFMLNGTHGRIYTFLSYFLNSLEYFCTATASVLWVWYVDYYLDRDVKRLRTRYMPVVVVWAVLVLLLIGNVFGEFLFSFDENNVYSREPLGYIYFLFLTVAYVMSIHIYYRFRAVHGHAKFFPLWMFLAPLVLSLVLQVFFYGISVTFLGSAVGLVSIYMNLQSKQSLVDRLTGLYNRAYFEHELIMARGSKKYIYSGIMLDIDKFKDINDSFGHSEGDNALKKTAQMILDAADRDSLAFRFAGDEFIILIRAEAGNTKELEERTLAMEARINKIAEKFNENGKSPYNLDFSMGHAVYDVNSSDDAFFKSMDAEMYKVKQSKR